MLKGLEIFLKSYKFVLGSIMLLILVTVGSAPGYCQKAETIEATAMGTGAQLGQNFEMRLVINDFSTLEERQVLV